jgi:hypothetical protein
MALLGMVIMDMAVVEAMVTAIEVDTEADMEVAAEE